MRTTGLRRLSWTAALVMVTGPGQPATVTATDGEPFQFFAPWVTVSDADRRRLDRDEAVVRTLSGGDGQLAVFAVTRLNAPPDALATWTRSIAELKRSRFVLALRSFSDPPALSDLDDLVLDDRDLEAIRVCTPGDCAVKLSAVEIQRLRAIAAAAGVTWRDAVQREFRRILVSRVNVYRSGGLAALPPIQSQSRPVRPAETFAAIMARSPYVTRVPSIAAWLQKYPDVDEPGVESFFYWSKEYYGGGKPVITVTHVGFVRSDAAAAPAVLVAGKQIFATHYLNGSLGLTAVLRDEANGTRYLVYLNRSQVDLLKGFFAPFRRSVLEGRLTGDTPEVIRALRRRLESGSPPVVGEGFPWARSLPGVAQRRR